MSTKFRKLTKVVWKGFKDKWPAAYKLLVNYRMKTEDQLKLLDAVNNQKKDLEEEITAWVAANEATWKPWVDDALSAQVAASDYP